MTWGSVHYDKARRKWRARAGDERRTGLGCWDTEEQAEAARAEAHRLAERQVRSTGPEAALVAYGRRWLDREERAGLRRGLDRERNRFERHLASAPFAEYPMVALTRGDVQQWVRELAAGKAEGPRGHGQRRSRRTVLRALDLLRVILRAAIDEGILDASPAEGVRVPREERVVEELTLLEAAEVARLVEARCIPLRSHAAFVVAAFGGLRPGELWGLRWEDVRLGGRAHLIVRHSRDRGTKTGQIRRVPLLEPARDILTRWQAAVRKARRGRDPRGLVWPGAGGRHHADGYEAGWTHRRNGRPGSERTQLGYRWRAGIDTVLPLKDLRHTCACHLLRGTWVAAGWIDRPLRLEEVSQWLGHASVTTTERYYARLAPGGLLDVVPAARHLAAVREEEW